MYDVERTLWVPTRKVRTAYTEFIGKETNAYSDAERIQLLIRWENRFDIDSLSLRIEIWNDANVTQASYMIYDFCKGNKGDYCDVKLSLDISPLKKAAYKMVYVFFEKDEYGNNKDLDIVFGLRFEKTDLDGNNLMVWNTRSWGYIELPSPRIIDLVTEKIN